MASMLSLKIYFDGSILPTFSRLGGKKVPLRGKNEKFLFTSPFFSCKFHFAFQKHSVSKFPVCRALRD
jgi:hypothetical protein